MKFSEPFSLAPYQPTHVNDLVRVGRSYDGGYVISRRCIPQTVVLLGLGISDDWSFEQDFSRLGDGIRTIGLDGSVSSHVFRKIGLQHLRAGMEALMRAKVAEALHSLEELRRFRTLASTFDRFFNKKNNQFIQKFLDDTDNENGIHWTSLLRSSLDSTRRRPLSVFVKMDIEGAEYRLLENLVKDSHLMNGMVIEFHDCGTNWDRFTKLMSLLLDSFALVHLHGNNHSRLIPESSTPAVLEVSLVNRRLLTGNEPLNREPYPLINLDQPNNPTKPDYPLHFD